VLAGRAGRARVLDFGLARAAGDEPDAAGAAAGPTPAFDVTLTRPGGVVGTPGYMAPEQQRGIADQRSDQYSFCVALFEALHGHLPSAPPPATRRQGPAWGDAARARR